MFLLNITRRSVLGIMSGRGGVRSTRGLGPTMTVLGQSIGISIGMLDKLIRTTLGLKRGAPSRAEPGAVAPLATLKRRL
jgi:hypothetical protein